MPKDLGWKDTLELIGIAAIIASLIFVGLQLKQSQDIAIASQYHARAALSVQHFSAEMESGDLKFWGSRDRWKADNDLSIEDRGRAVLRSAAYLIMVDNHYYQYEAGFLEEDVWQNQLNGLKRQLRINGRLRSMIRARKILVQPSFLNLANELLDDMDPASYQED
jgi:hypothetical protein